MKLSKHHTLRETRLSFRTKKLRLRRSLQDLQIAKKFIESLRYNFLTGQFQPPPVLSPSRTYIGASGLWESALIGNPYQSAVILYGFSCCCHFGGIEEESKPSQAKELPQFPQNAADTMCTAAAKMVVESRFAPTTPGSQVACCVKHHMKLGWRGNLQETYENICQTISKSIWGFLCLTCRCFGNHILDSWSSKKWSVSYFVLVPSGGFSARNIKNCTRLPVPFQCR